MRAVCVQAEALRRLAAELLESAGAPPHAAALTGDLLVRADLADHSSHGVRLVPTYCALCRSGTVDPRATPIAERDDGSTVTLDARCGLGQVAARHAVALAVERSEQFGVAIVTVRRSGHVGRLADYAEQGAGAGAIVVMAANDSGANQVVAPYGSREPRLATNPLAIGIPRANEPHLVLDMATSVVSHGTVELKGLANETVPAGWMTGGALLPVGGPKGTGLALAVDVLAGMLSGAGFSSDEPALAYQGLWILALDPSRFLPGDVLATSVERLVAHVRSAGDEVLMPAERGARSRDERLTHGVPMPEQVWADLCALADEHGVSIPTAKAA